MFSKMDKAWVAGVVSFACLQIQHWAGLTVDPHIQAGIVGVILFAVTYLMPNKKT